MSARSGTIRSAIGLIKKRLTNNIKIATPLVNTTIPIDPKLAEVFGDSIDSAKAKLETSVASLVERDHQWNELMIKLDEGTIPIEEELYEQTACSADGYLAVLEEAKELISLLNFKRSQIGRSVKPSVASGSSNNTSNGCDSNKHQKSAKLPKLELPMFDGDPTQWHRFWTIFEANVDKAELTGVEKFSYLNSRLKPNSPAADAIAGLPITDEAYKTAIDILKSRFERSPQQLVSSLYSQLKRLPSSSDKVKDMQRTYDACEKIIRQLRDAKEDIDQNRSLVLDVYSKYPEKVLADLTIRKIINTQSTLVEVQSALKDYIQASDDLSDMLQNLQPFDQSKSTRVQQRSSTKSVVEDRSSHSTNSSAWNNSTALSVTEVTNKTQNTGGMQPQSPCYFCNGQHFNSQCDQYVTSDQRYKRLAEVNRCQRCLNSSHITTECKTSPSRLRCHFCQSSGLHASPLCPGKFCSTNSSNGTGNLSASGSTTPKMKSSSTKPQQKTDNNVADPCILGVEERALLATAVTTIRNPLSGNEREVRVILDNGCPRTFILQSVAKELGLSAIPANNLYISAFGCKRTATYPSRQVQFEMSLRSGEVMNIMANTIELIVNRSAQPEKLPQATQQLMESLGSAMADNLKNDGPPEILIGSDYFWQIIACNRMTSDDGIYLIPSGLGFLLGGRFQADEDDHLEYPSLLCLTERTSGTSIETNLSAISSVSRTSQQYPDVDEFWDLERIGIADDPVESDDEVAQQQFDDTIYFDGSRYQVAWPWKQNHDRLPTNYALAQGRLKSLMKRLSDDGSTLREEYEKTIASQLESGIIEAVPPSEFHKSKNPIHYLPHHPVVRVGHSTTKVRIVYDASAQSGKDQLSLNECLYRGPVILPDLCSILIRFRLHNVAIIADIEKAFLQIGLQASQRDVTRFLWSRPDGTILIYRFKRVPFGVVSSSFLLSGTVRHHTMKVGTPVSLKIHDDIYVDNVLSGAGTADEAIQFYDEAKQMFNDASMNLREWGSNSPQLLNHIPDHDKAAKSNIKVLGLSWDCISDVFQLQNNWSNCKECFTKRDVLKAIASIYDPLGLFQPCTLRAKCFLRDLWKNNLGWDEQVSDEYKKRWDSIQSDITPIFDVRITRIIDYSQCNDDMCLVAFSDASKDAYATSVYLRTKSASGDGLWATNLVYAKSRLAPKNQTISLPRLELLGLVIAARAADFVRSSFNLTTSIRCYMFCDAVCVLSWLKTDKPLQKFVGNRIKEIQQVENAEYHHVRSCDNPADISTRGLAGSEIETSDLWWFGPSWLQQDSVNWPTKDVIDIVSDDDFRKETKDDRQEVTLLVGEGHGCENALTTRSSRFSSWRRLLRTSVYVIKFIKRLLWNHISRETRKRYPIFNKMMQSVSEDIVISSNDIACAKILLVKAVQSVHFSNVITAIKSAKSHQLMKQFNLQLDDDGLIRCYGRLRHADLDDEALMPVLLPKKDPVTDLIITDAHRRLFHSGPSHTLSQLRRQYWILHGRSAVRKVYNGCIICRKGKGHPFALPKMPPWPRERVSRSQPFQFTGLDYFGPATVKLPDGSIQKMWCCLFTCLAVRAIHLECVTDCTSQSFMECLSRFIARRGCPERVISDNAPQFRLAKTTFDRTWQSVMMGESVQSYIADHGIQWKFTTELAPWQGGFYERLVGVVKSSFKSMIGRRLLRWDEFITLITETEAIVNSRPITYVYGDINSGLALRPMDFLSALPTGTPTVDPTVRPEGGEAGKFLLKFWRSKQNRLDTVWKQWYNEYLLSLRERDQATHKGSRSALHQIPVVGEVVILKNTEIPRGQWKLVKVLSHVPSNDGTVRAVELKLPNGVVLKRPINHLYRLEVPSSQEQIQPANPTLNGSQDDDDAEFHGFELHEAYPNDSDDRQSTSDCFNDQNNSLEQSLLAAIPSARESIASALCTIAIPAN